MNGYADLYKKQKRKLWPGHKPGFYYYFHLSAPNNEVICQSEQYQEKISATVILASYFSNFEVRDHTDKEYTKFPRQVR